MKNKPDLASLFGASKSDTFLGLDSCNHLESIKASSAVIGVPCATPYKSVGPYAKNGPSSIRNAIASLNANLDRHNFDLGGPIFPKGSIKAVDCAQALKKIQVINNSSSFLIIPIPDISFI